MEVVAAFQTEIAMLLVTKTTLLFDPTLLCSLTPNPHFHHDYGLGVNQSRRIYRRGRLNGYLLEGLNSLRWLAVDVVAINWEHILLWRPARFVYLNSDDDSTYNYNYSYYYANYQSNVGATTTYYCCCSFSWRYMKGSCLDKAYNCPCLKGSTPAYISYTS